MCQGDRLTLLHVHSEQSTPVFEGFTPDFPWLNSGYSPPPSDHINHMCRGVPLFLPHSPKAMSHSRGIPGGMSNPAYQIQRNQIGTSYIIMPSQTSRTSSRIPSRTDTLRVRGRVLRTSARCPGVDDKSRSNARDIRFIFSQARALSHYRSSVTRIYPASLVVLRTCRGTPAEFGFPAGRLLRGRLLHLWCRLHRLRPRPAPDGSLSQGQRLSPYGARCIASTQPPIEAQSAWPLFHRCSSRFRQISTAQELSEHRASQEPLSGCMCTQNGPGQKGNQRIFLGFRASKN